MSGLFAAREIATHGYSVLVLEEDMSIGEPEKCDGLVSAKGLAELGIVPARRVVQNEINKAVLHSPGGVDMELDASHQKVVVLDREEFDIDLARAASLSGADIRVGSRVEHMDQKRNSVSVKTSRSQQVNCKFAVDARGYQSLARTKKNGVLQAARYEIEASWIVDNTVELYFDQQVCPGFFIWVIPMGKGIAKLGAAGKEINSFRVLDDFIDNKGGRVTKKVAAPIVVSGPIKHFVIGRIITIGDAAGQAKPTTGGGIYTGGVGGLLAGKAITNALVRGRSALLEYEKSWNKKFKAEFRKMTLARRLFDRMENRHIDRAFEAINSSGVLKSVSYDGDFDFHTPGLLKALGVKNLLEVAGLTVTAELKELLVNLKDSIG